MIRRTLIRLARMDRAEIAWRGTAAARTWIDRARTRLAAPRYARTDLLAALAPGPGLHAVREALNAQRWDVAQRELATHFSAAPRRFAISPASKPALVNCIRREFPDAARDAADRADRIVDGHYDLLAYRGRRFGASALPDWHLDPVLDRRPPRAFWASVPYLDPQNGDHKIIWELNRHQHWLALGRASWLTGDRRYRDRCLAELDSWLDANPPLIGVNWASMLELAFRSISWLWAIQLFAGDPQDDDPPWLVDLLVALDRQLGHVERNLSYYFSPNTHLLGEALALYVTGQALPELAAGTRRASTGRRILIDEIDRQIAPDGGHRERSTHYHRYTLDFYALALLTARQTGDADAIAPFEDAVQRLGAAARLLADDTGRVPHIGDDDAGALTPLTGRDPDDVRDSLAVAAALVNRPDLPIGPPPEEARWLLGADAALQLPASSAQPVSGALPDTGYYVSRARGCHLVIDGGPHGYQNGGHAHADALSLTFAVRGVPLLIDPGTGCYTTDAAMRDRMRSTALHNALTLDGRSQSLPSGPFHWSHVAASRVHRWRTADGFDYFDGSQDGYRPTEHRRRVLALHGDLLVVADFVGGSESHDAAVHWHLDPRWIAEPRARGAVFTQREDRGNRVGLTVPAGCVDAFTADAETGLGWCSPAYGRVDPTTTVRVSHGGAAPFWMVSVFDLDPDNPVAAVDWVPVWAEAGTVAHATAIRITRTRSIDHMLCADPEPAAAADVKPRWRVGDVETDARMLFYRAAIGRPLACLASIEATTARTRNQELLNLEPPSKVFQCAASPVS
jgi:heparinase II/III-like protein